MVSDCPRTGDTHSTLSARTRDHMGYRYSTTSVPGETMRTGSCSCVSIVLTVLKSSPHPASGPTADAQINKLANTDSVLRIENPPFIGGQRRDSINSCECRTVHTVGPPIETVTVAISESTRRSSTTDPAITD